MYIQVGDEESVERTLAKAYISILYMNPRLLIEITFKLD